MNLASPASRRDFISNVTLGAAALAALPALSASAAEKKKAAPKAAAPPKKNYRIIAFSKPFRDKSPEETADIDAEVGWDGIECGVRAKDTHIELARVEEDLPKMVEALKKRGKEVTIVTSDITRLNPAGEKVLRTMAKLGIKKYRLGFEKYPKDVHPSRIVAEV